MPLPKSVIVAHDLCIIAQSTDWKSPEGCQKFMEYAVQTLEAWYREPALDELVVSAESLKQVADLLEQLREKLTNSHVDAAAEDVTDQLINQHLGPRIRLEDN